MAKLLLMSSDTLFAKALQARLAKHAGLQVAWFTNAHDGLAQARHWIPDLLIVDALLPGLNGLDVLKLLRDVPALVTKHVVLLVERTLTPDLLQECLLWGADSYLQKDTASLDEIMTHLQTLLQSLPASPPSAPEPSAR